MDTRLACRIENGEGQPVGIVQTVSTGGWQQVAQFFGAGTLASWEFEILRADGVPYLRVSRPLPSGWRQWPQRFEVRDSSGRHIGSLVQNDSWRSFNRTFDLEAAQTVIGHTTFDYQRIDGARGEIAAQTVTIHDSTGRSVARIAQRRTTAFLFGNEFYDYTLTFDYAPPEPMGTLCFAVTLAEYFYRRTEHGGTLRGFPGVYSP
ncbi:hypothetical protein MFM001_05350 [Mycobacterium sp. MFM001]|uniref:hypothetical protein n=1 Tax=Mycobacterium sp. MFM001 TaxID=2049453 RepID=UPI000DA4E746|nr:hypothetical protein [Mycobacterium sp. MFM001]GBE64073.1 hypothetical protein MFM001_05350 [Mycobacterium sp. MFM001]